MVYKSDETKKVLQLDILLYHYLPPVVEAAWPRNTDTLYVRERKENDSK